MTAISHTCPDIGVWRAWLDHEDQSPHVAEHLPGCPACQRLVADLEGAAADVRDALSVLAPAGFPSAAETAAARERFRSLRDRVVQIRNPSREPIPMFFAHTSIPWRMAVGGLAAALVLSLLVAFTPQGGQAAASFLAQFRSHEVAAVEVSPQTQSDITRTLNTLANLGTIKTPGGLVDSARPEAAARGAAKQVKSASMSEASQSVGFEVETPDPETLPAGLDKDPQIRVMPASQVRFTFDKARARAYFESTGHPEVDLPDEYDGATLVVSIPSAAVLQYGNSSTRDALIVGEAGELVVDVEGGKVSLPEMRDFLLGLPGLPQATTSQLKQIQNWNETLPIPIPVDKVNWQTTTFKGNKGLLLNDNSGVGSAAIWHASGRLYGIAGSLKATQLRRIADSLAVNH